MALAGSFSRPAYHAARRFGPRSGLIVLIALLFSGAAVIVTDSRLQTLFAAIGAILLFCAFWLVIMRRHMSLRADDHVLQVAAMIEDDPVPVILADTEGTVLRANPSARRAFPVAQVPTVDVALCETFANPCRILREMERNARIEGAAVRHLPAREGFLRIGVHRVGEGRFLWRFQQGPSASLPEGEAEHDALPMLTVGRDNSVLGLNLAAREMLGDDVPSLDDVCPQRSSRSGDPCVVATPDGPVNCLLIEREGANGQRAVHLIPTPRAADLGVDGWALFEELPVPLLKVEQDGMLVQSNRPARALLGVDSTHDMRLGDTLEGLGRSIKDWIDDAASERGTVHAEFLRVRRDDREVFVQVTLNRAMEDGKIVLIAVMNDATELKSLEAQFVQSQKMQAIGQLAGGVAHDFNNLLTAITGHCDLLLLRHDQGDPDYADLMQINQNANRAAALVSQLLAYSRKQTLRPQLIDLRETLADLTHLLNRLVGEKVTLGLKHDPALSAIRADKRQLEQVIMNLVVNARDAMPRGGDIRILTENVTLAKPLRRDRAVVAPGRYVSVRIIDEGVGIPPDKAQKVFEPFFTTKRAGEGTGLGLSTAYGIIKQTGGFIFLDSVPQQGTVFQLLFPAHDRPDPVEQTDAEDVSQVGLASGVVLLVEDEAPVRAFASRALQLKGFTVHEAESAKDALALLEDEALHVDVFVTDVVMPGMDGPSWVQRALVSRPKAKVVFMSGYAEETFGEVQVSIPNSVFLPKPFSLKELTDTVQRQTA